MSYIFGKENTDKRRRNSELYEELHEQRRLEEQDITIESSRKDNEFEEVFKKLDHYSVDGPSQHQTQSLLSLAASYAALSEQVDVQAGSRRVRRYDRLVRESVEATTLPVRLMKHMIAQTRTLHWLFWLISALMVGIGAVIEGLTTNGWFSSPTKPDIFLYTMLLLPIASVAYSLRSMHTPMGELEATFPVSPLQLMVARIGTILLYDLFLALMFYGVLSLTGDGVQFGGTTAVVVADLLLPICLSTFAALTAMLCFGTWPGTVLVLAIGIIQFSAGERLGIFHLFSQYGSHYWLLSKLIAVTLSAMLGICTSMLLRHRYYYKRNE